MELNLLSLNLTLCEKMCKNTLQLFPSISHCHTLQIVMDDIHMNDTPDVYNT